ncbi:hypothetical protein BD779DRAFT_1784936 [Infundibulicybe gibba]|nr:hypothetical protein BD779DRAFT_1784936 [Infundibulicybe gibba]
MDELVGAGMASVKSQAKALEELANIVQKNKEEHDAERAADRAAMAAERATMAAHFERVYKALDGDKEALASIRLRNTLACSEKKLVQLLQLPVKSSHYNAASLRWRKFVESQPAGKKFERITALIRQQIRAGAPGASDLKIFLPASESDELGPGSQKALNLLILGGGAIRKAGNTSAHEDLNEGLYDKYKDAVQDLYERSKDKTHVEDTQEGFDDLFHFIGIKPPAAQPSIPSSSST